MQIILLPCNSQKLPRNLFIILFAKNAWIVMVPVSVFLVWDSQIQKVNQSSFMKDQWTKQLANTFSEYLQIELYIKIQIRTLKPQFQ